MSPIKTIVISKGSKLTRESVSGESFSLTTHEVAQLLGIARNTVFQYEAKSTLPTAREPCGSRNFSDAQLLDFARQAKGVIIEEKDEGKQITGKSGNIALVPWSPK